MTQRSPERGIGLPTSLKRGAVRALLAAALLAGCGAYDAQEEPTSTKGDQNTAAESDAKIQRVNLRKDMIIFVDLTNDAPFGNDELSATGRMVHFAFEAINRSTNGYIKMPFIGMGGPFRAAISPQELCGTNDDARMKNATKLRRAVQSAALRRGYDPLERDLTLLVPDGSPCPMHERGYAVSGTTYREDSGTWAILYNRADRATAIHELGHALKLGHSNALTCTDGGRPSADLTGDETCQLVEYGDAKSIMGGGVDNPTLDRDLFSGFALWRLGAISDEQLTTVASPGVYDIEIQSLRSRRPGTRLVRIPINHNGMAQAMNSLSKTGRPARNLSYMVELSDDTEYSPDGEKSSVKVYAADIDEPEPGGWPNSAIVDLAVAEDSDPKSQGAGKDRVGETIFVDQASGVAIDLLDLDTDAQARGEAKVRVRLG